MYSDMQGNIAFVVLQYGAYEETQKCIKSIKKYVNGNFVIIVVDNASPDNAYSKVQAEFGKDEQVVLIKSEINLGFAKGNNLGINYAAKNYNPDFVVVLNNDTELIDCGFREIVYEEYYLSRFYAMGPMILSGDGRYTSSPCRASFWNVNNIKKCIRNEKIFLFLAEHNLGCFYTLFTKLKGKKEKQYFDKNFFLKKQENVELHGSFLVFSRYFLKDFGGFDSRTFLYCEEPILYHKLKNNGAKIVYNPKLKIYHAEDVSTNKIYQKKKSKQIFYLKNHIESCKVLLDVMDEGKDTESKI